MAKPIEQPPKWSFLPSTISQKLDLMRDQVLQALNAETPTERYKIQKNIDALYKGIEREMSYLRPLKRRSVVYKTHAEALEELLAKGWVTFEPAERENREAFSRLQNLGKRTALRTFRGSAASGWRKVHAAPAYLLELARTTGDEDLLNKALRAKTSRSDIVQAAKFIDASKQA